MQHDPATTPAVLDIEQLVEEVEKLFLPEDSEEEEDEEADDKVGQRVLDTQSVSRVTECSQTALLVFQGQACFQLLRLPFLPAAACP